MMSLRLFHKVISFLVLFPQHINEEVTFCLLFALTITSTFNVLFQHWPILYNGQTACKESKEFDKCYGLDGHSSNDHSRCGFSLPPPNQAFLCVPTSTETVISELLSSAYANREGKSFHWSFCLHRRSRLFVAAQKSKGIFVLL